MEKSLPTIGWLLVFMAAGLVTWRVWPEAEAPPPPPSEGGFELVYRPHLDAAREAGLATPDETDDMLLAQTMGAVGSRVRALGIAHVDVRRDGNEHVVVTVSDDARQRVNEVMAAISPKEIPTTPKEDAGPSGPDLRFRLVVEPWKSALSVARHADVRDVSPPRLWPEDRDAFDRYLAGEVLEWQKARTDGVRYVPTRDGFEVVKKVARPGDEMWDFIVVRTPTSSLERLFGGTILSDPVARPAVGSHRFQVDCRIATAFRKAFGDFTYRNRGLKLALILDDESTGEPVIQERLDETVAIALGTGSEAEARALAAALASSQSSGVLRVRLGLVEQRERATSRS